MYPNAEGLRNLNGNPEITISGNNYRIGNRLITS